MATAACHTRPRTGPVASVGRPRELRGGNAFGIDDEGETDTIYRARRELATGGTYRSELPTWLTVAKLAQRLYALLTWLIR